MSGSRVFCTPNPLSTANIRAKSGTMDKSVAKVRAEARSMQWSAKNPWKAAITTRA